MKIISVPNTTLRQKAKTVEKVDKKLLLFLDELQRTLAAKDDPKGVGLAAPQVNMLWRIFTTQLPIGNNEDETELRTYINPKIIDKSDELTLGLNKRKPVLEGCLSIPGIYGPVPRHSWIQLEYQVLNGDQLETRTEHFKDFAARVAQHELDHLEGILFIDYFLEYDLPLYKDKPNSNDIEEIDPAVIPALIQRTR